MTDQANPQLEHVEDLFKSLVWDSIVKAALAYVFVEVPWLDFWPMKPFLTFFVEKLSGAAFALLKEQFDLAAISFTNEQHKAEFDKASVALKVIARDKSIDSDAFKEARENAKIALSRFIRFGAVLP